MEYKDIQSNLLFIFSNFLTLKLNFMLKLFASRKGLVLFKQISFAVTTFLLIYTSYSFRVKPTVAHSNSTELLGLYLSAILTEDTVKHKIGDTIAVYSSGLDTVYVTYAEAIPDSLAEELWVINDPHKEMVIQLSHHDAAVNEGVIGINLSDFFQKAGTLQKGHGNYDHNTNYTGVEDPWEAMVALKPKTVRIFSGAGSKFMHPLGYYDDEDEINYGGYGYFWKELIPLYDRTENVNVAPSEISIISELSDGECDPGELIWIKESFREDFSGYYNKSVSQQDDALYITQFINMIDEIETGGHVVDVIYCVNILTQSASEMLDVIDYLELYGVNVVGVELGNEVYFEFHNLALGMTDFEHYWEYINGGNYSGGEETALLAVLPDYMEEDHDYIGNIKGRSEYHHIKIGLPAQNIPNCGEAYDIALFDDPTRDEEITEDNAIPVDRDPDPGFIDPCDCFYPQWNLDMVTHYADVTTESTNEYYKFDAIIFHNYYTPKNNSILCEGNSNWMDIMCEMHPEYDGENLDLDYWDPYIYEGPWNYADGGIPTAPDEDLKEAFYKINGISYPDDDDELVPGNFKEFTRDRIDYSYEEHALQMLFTDTDEDPTYKEVWVTEYNLHDGLRFPNSPEGKANQNKVQPYASTVTNTFSHAAMLQNWFLWNIKSSFDPDYRPYFLTRATVQNAIGGTTIDLMNEGDAADQKLLGEISSCTTSVKDPFFVRRATYFAMQLWRVISDNHLHYLKTETTMASLNDNLAPTIFIDEAEQKIYVFYTLSLIHI